MAYVPQMSYAPMATAPSGYQAYQSVSAPVYQSVSAPAYQSVSAPAYQSVSAPAYQSVSAPAYQSVSAPAYQSVSAPVYQSVSAPAYSYPSYQPQVVYQSTPMPSYQQVVYQPATPQAMQPQVYQAPMPVPVPVPVSQAPKGKVKKTIRPEGFGRIVLYDDQNRPLGTTPLYLDRRVAIYMEQKGAKDGKYWPSNARPLKLQKKLATSQKKEKKPKSTQE